MSTRLQEAEEKLKNLAKEVVKECLTDKAFMDSFIDKIIGIATKKVSDEFDKTNKKVNELEKQVNKMHAQNIDDEEKISKKMKVMEQQLSKMQNENEQLKVHVTKMERNIDNNDQNNVGQIKYKLNDMEQLSKLLQLRVYGITEEKEENLKVKLLDIFEKNMDVINCQVDNCYRIGIFKEQSKNSRPVIVQFLTTEDRNRIFYNKKKLKGTKIAIVEELIKQRYELMKQAREKFDRKDVWTKLGKIYVKLNGEIHIIKSSDDMEKILTKK